MADALSGFNAGFQGQGGQFLGNQMARNYGMQMDDMSRQAMPQMAYEDIDYRMGKRIA